MQEEIEHTRQEPVPLHLRNAPTRLMKELDYGKGYRYAHDEEDKVADMDCLPDSLKGPQLLPSHARRAGEAVGGADGRDAEDSRGETRRGMNIAFWQHIGGNGER